MESRKQFFLSTDLNKKKEKENLASENKAHLNSYETQTIFFKIRTGI